MRHAIRHSVRIGDGDKMNDMMVDTKPPGLDNDRLAEAANWYARLHSDSADEATWSQFLLWLEADKAHSLAFDQVEDIYEELETARGSLNVKQDQASMIVALNAWRGLRKPLISRTGAGVFGLLAACLVVIIGFNRVHTTNAETRYATQVGETRKISLADGSVIEMNTGSRLVVTFNKTQRLVRLDKGEALFQVAKDPGRPFLVTVGDREIRDLGTIYNVLRSDDQVTVTVAEGMVAVSPHAGKVQSADDLAVQVSPGEQLVFNDGAAKPLIRRIDTDGALAWRQGYLTYKDAPLSQVASDLNRYFIHPVTLKDSNTGAHKFSGILKIDNEDAVLKRLAELVPVAADQSADGSIVLRLKP